MYDINKKANNTAVTAEKPAHTQRACIPPNEWDRTISFWLCDISMFNIMGRPMHGGPVKIFRKR